MFFLFDLDGTLIDSALVMRECWSAVQEKTGVFDVSFESYFANIGVPFHEILSKIGFPADLADEAKAVYFDTAITASQRAPLFPGVYDMLHDLKSRGATLGVLTSKSIAATRSVLSTHGLTDLFSVVMCPDLFPGLQWKPSPDPINHLVNHFNYDVGSVVYVGDMSVDHACARQAGAHYVHCTYGYEPDYRPVWDPDLPVSYARAVPFLHLELVSRLFTSSSHRSPHYAKT